MNVMKATTAATVVQPPTGEYRLRSQHANRGTSKDVNIRSSADSLASTEQKLHVLRRQLLHGDLIVIDGTVDHVGLLFLEHDHPRFNGIFDTKSSDNTRTLLADTMATISRLPFCCRVPPSMGDMRSVYSVHRWRGMKVSEDLRINDEHPGGLREV